MNNPNDILSILKSNKKHYDKINKYNIIIKKLDIIEQQINDELVYKQNQIDDLLKSLNEIININKQI